MALSASERSRGKAAVDLVGSQAGKSGASCLVQGLLLASGSLAGAMPMVCVLFFGVMALWLGALRQLHCLGKQEERDAAQQAQQGGAGAVADGPAAAAA